MRKGKSSERRQTRARILLKANEGMSNRETIGARAVSEDMVSWAHQRTDKQCAHLIATAGSDVPEGQAHGIDRTASGIAKKTGSAPVFCGRYPPVAQLLAVRLIAGVSMPVDA